MFAAQFQVSQPPAAAVAATVPSSLSPAAMALYLRRTNGAAAYCFARVMWEDSAWANEDWGDYWASVMRLV